MEENPESFGCATMILAADISIALIIYALKQ